MVYDGDAGKYYDWRFLENDPYDTDANDYWTDPEQA